MQFFLLPQVLLQFQQLIIFQNGENDLGGLKEWNTDMPLEADFILDDEAQKLADEAASSSMCIPIGEGENCW